MRGLVISAPSSGQGKTVITLGLLRALRLRGVRVASAKSGPDYIDPAFHTVATGHPSVTLDAWAAGPARLRARAAMLAGVAERLVVEGAMGVFDGGVSDGPVGRGATAEVAAALGLPVILVLDAAGMGQTAGAIAAGLAGATPGVEIAGVILNRVASPRHGAMLRAGLAPVCPVIGEIPKEADLHLPSRHLGLVQARETAALEGQIARIAAVIGAACDLDALMALAASLAHGGQNVPMPPLGQRIAVARDDAFSFAYWHQIEDWRAAGAEISFFSPLADQGPEAGSDAVFLPGGYPELHACTLAAADIFRAAMAAVAARGALIYGECGGYMVLGEALVDAQGTGHRMLGLLRVETSFHQRKRHLGYRTVRGQAPLAGPFAAHEFHYSTTLSEAGTPLFDTAFDAAGARLPPMGLRDGRVMGSFAHLIEVAD
ncbi:MAG: cobyrinate a,c-diamide synthase [Pseudomonadota bacterium]